MSTIIPGLYGFEQGTIGTLTIWAVAAAVNHLRPPLRGTVCLADGHGTGGSLARTTEMTTLPTAHCRHRTLPVPDTVYRATQRHLRARTFLAESKLKSGAAK